jgi:uncharacterized protein
MAALIRIVKRYPLVTFFTLAFCLTWANWLPQALASRGLLSITVPDFLTVISGYGPALAAIIVTALTTGKLGLRLLFGRLVRWRVGLRWYAVVLLTPICITLTAVGLHLLTGGTAPNFTQSQLQLGPSDAPAWQEILLLFLLFTLGFDGLGEELGWRGYALPKLQTGRSALSASLILGGLWAAWHVPYAMTQGSFLSSIPLAWFFLNMLASAILYTWVFNNTQGSVLLTVLFHAANNTTSNVLPILPPATNDLRIYFFSIGVQWCLALLVVIISGRDYFSRNARLQSELTVEPVAGM